eukprot:UN29623
MVTQHRVNQESKESLYQEAKSWAMIPNHQNICRFIGLCVDYKHDNINHICLVSEYIKD